jgi:chromatin segregation and condensation protein Rec8/ScpA/Scc1 (kleisin family)
MFGNTDITKIEQLLEQVVANQERMLRCWEDKPVKQLAEKPVKQSADEPVVEQPAAKKYDRRGYRAKIFYVSDPLGFIERKIDSATRTSNCIYLAALLVTANDGAKGNREKITADKLSELLLELAKQGRITAISSKGTGDIGVRITSDKPLQPMMNLLSISEFKASLSLFSRWGNNG